MVFELFFCVSHVSGVWTTMMNGGRMETHWQRHAKETAELFTAFSVIERRFAAHTERLLCLMRIWYILDTFVATLALIECPLLFKCFSQFVKHSWGGLVCVSSVSPHAHKWHVTVRNRWHQKNEKTRFVAKGQDSGAKMRSQQEHRTANWNSESMKKNRSFEVSG